MMSSKNRKSRENNHQWIVKWFEKQPISTNNAHISWHFEWIPPVFYLICDDFIRQSKLIIKKSKNRWDLSRKEWPIGDLAAFKARGNYSASEDNLPAPGKLSLDLPCVRKICYERRKFGPISNIDGRLRIPFKEWPGFAPKSRKR